VHLVFDDRAFATWVPAHGWQVEAGPYGIAIGRSSADIAHRAVVTVSPRRAAS